MYKKIILIPLITLLIACSSVAIAAAESSKPTSNDPHSREVEMNKEQSIRYIDHVIHTAQVRLEMTNDDIGQQHTNLSERPSTKLVSRQSINTPADTIQDLEALKAKITNDTTVEDLEQDSLAMKALLESLRHSHL
jgi:hypothetical protein